MSRKELRRRLREQEARAQEQTPGSEGEHGGAVQEAEPDGAPLEPAHTANAPEEGMPAKSSSAQNLSAPTTPAQDLSAPNTQPAVKSAPVPGDQRPLSRRELRARSAAQNIAPAQAQGTPDLEHEAGRQAVGVPHNFAGTNLEATQLVPEVPKPEGRKSARPTASAQGEPEREPQAARAAQASPTETSSGASHAEVSSAANPAGASGEREKGRKSTGSRKHLSADDFLQVPAAIGVEGSRVQGQHQARQRAKVVEMPPAAETKSSPTAAQMAAAREAMAYQVANQGAAMRAQEAAAPGSLSEEEILRHQQLAKKAEELQRTLQEREATQPAGGPARDTAGAPESAGQPQAVPPAAAPRVATSRAAASTGTRNSATGATATGATTPNGAASGATAPPKEAGAPSEVTNLAMVKPLEFEQHPGNATPVMKRPPTNHVPVITSRSSSAAGPVSASSSTPTAPEPSRSAQRPQRRQPAGSAATGAQERLGVERGPVGASNAHGLQILTPPEREYVRRRKYFIGQMALLALGLGTLVTGIVLIIISAHR